MKHNKDKVDNHEEDSEVMNINNMQKALETAKFATPM